MASSSSSSSSSSSFYRQWKYDVFLSFRGEDVRKNFVDHLYTALCHRGIHTFKDDEELERGKEISPELLKAIEQSRLALIVFSENYASSSWCLDELAKIIECKKLKSQMVVPVFYEVDPSHVQKQEGSFAKDFAKHEKVYTGKMEKKVQTWRAALEEAATVPGWDTQNIANGYEAKCIQEIVRGIFSKLGHTLSSMVRDLVGIDSRVEEVCSLLDTRLDDVRVIGIWGMGGIGKTTIAKAVYDQISHQFEDSCFLAVRNIFEKYGMEVLQQKLHSIASRVHFEKVLVILDDVDQVAELEVFFKRHYLVGLGSRIIITTRDSHLLITLGVDIRYEVKKLDRDEALQLFCSKAFKQSHPPEAYDRLSKSVVRYAGGIAGGIPLALNVLGSSLFGRNENEWKGTLSRLQKIPDNDILQVLQISFDRLDAVDQQIFLDIACFLDGEEKDFVTRILDGCDFDPDIGISILVEKSLLTISGDRVQMHALLREMGWHVVRQEDPREPGRRSRLWILEDVCHVLAENTVTDAIEGICLNFNIPMPKDLNFSTEAFKKMNKLRLLKIRSTQLSEGLNCISNELSWLNWYGYPCKSLPPSFKATKLVELCMHDSNIIELWKGKKILDKLVSMDLSHSLKLRSTPDFTGLPNLMKLILEDCASLVELDPSIAFHKKLILLNLKNCRSLKSLPNSIQLVSLNTLILSGCLKLDKFPEIVGNMECLSKLCLDGTAVEELPLSIERLSRIVLMNLKDCKYLKSLPESICSLRCLKILDISGCIKLDELPQKFGEMEFLEELYANETAIKQLPSSIVLLRNLKTLSFRGYKGKISKSFCSPFTSCLLEREPQNSMSLVLRSVMGLHWLAKLDISDCNLFAWQFPSDLGRLSSLEELNLSRNNLANIPASINHLSQLRTLWLVGCSRLEALLQLPTSIVELYADDCTSLGLSDLSTEYKSLTKVSFSGCSNLLASHQSDNLAALLVQHMLQLVLARLQLKDKKGFTVIDFRPSFLLPGSEIPNWFTHQNMGHSISIELPSNWYNEKLMGIAICVVYESLPDKILSSSSGYLQKLSTISVKFKFSNHDNRKYFFSASVYRRGIEKKVNSKHLCIGYIAREALYLKNPHIWCQLEVFFQDDEYSSPKQFWDLVAEKAALRLVYQEDAEKINETMLEKYGSQLEDLRLFDTDTDGGLELEDEII